MSKVIVTLEFDYAPNPKHYATEHRGSPESMFEFDKENCFQDPIYLAEMLSEAKITAQLAERDTQQEKQIGREPTDAMQAAGARAIRFDTTPLNKIWTANAVFRAMWDAALSAQANQNGEKDQ